MDFVLEASIDEFRYQRRAQPALRTIDLRVREGEFVIITGSAGSGKTTLCYCLTGVIPHFTNGSYGGDIKVQGQSLGELKLPEIAGRVGFVLQRPENQLFSLTVAEDVAFGPENLCKDPDDILTGVDRSLAFVGMERFAGRTSNNLSGGEAQRCVLSCIMAMDPDLFILDQPAAELDPLGRRQIYENIHHLNRDAGKTIILVEDRLSDVLPFASRIILLRDGQIVKDAAPEEFFADKEVISSGIRLPDHIKLYHLLKDRNLASEQIYFNPLDAADHLRPLIGSPREVTLPNKIDNQAHHKPLSTASYALEVHDLRFRYPKSDSWALQDLNLGFKSGEFTAIIGENGAGKTTLAKHFIGLLRPTKGSISLNGRDIAKTPTAHLSNTIGYLFQDPDYQTFSSSAFDEVAFSLKIRKVPRDRIEQQVNDTLRKLRLYEVRDLHPYLLSRGQRQRLSLASIMVHSPQILVVDEPSTGLDYRETIEMMDLLVEFREAGGTILMITHDMEMVMRYAERSIVMAGGKILADVATMELHKHCDAMTKAAIQLPDFYQLIAALGLPPACHDVEEVAQLVFDNCSARPRQPMASH